MCTFEAFGTGILTNRYSYSSDFRQVQGRCFYGSRPMEKADLDGAIFWKKNPKNQVKFQNFKLIGYGK
jgi:hypothetical protein